jgi:peptidoglycan/xylan/chitin deacetylase (PgdA/CDA1 family)
VTNTQHNASQARADWSRRTLLVLGGMVLLGGCSGTNSAGTSSTVAGGEPRPPATEPASTHPAGQAANCGKAAKPRQTKRAQRGAAQENGEQPVYYVDEGPRAIVLSIDDGPHPLYTPQILRLLRRHKVTAAFSMVGVHVDAYAGVAREVSGAGHMIVNHTRTHGDLAAMTPGAVTSEMDYASDAIHRATGRTPDMFRAPYGAWSPVVLRHCMKTGMTPLDWSVDPRDWARPGVNAIINNIMSHTRRGSIILEHDGGGDRSQTVAALTFVVPRLLDAGYHFVLPQPGQPARAAETTPPARCADRADG